MADVSGKLIEKIGHDDPNCGSSDALAVYEKEDGSHDGYCWSCGQWVPDPYGEKDGKPKGKRNSLQFQQKTHEEKMQEVMNIWSNYPTLALTDRSITAETAAYFGVKVGVDPADGVTITEHYYPMVKNGTTSGYKKRVCATKQFYIVGDGKDVELFGQMQARATGAKKLIITEGECDAMAVYQVLTDLSKGTQYESYRPAVVSITKGADQGDGTKVINELAAQQEFLNLFDEIILAFDQDQPGEISAKAIATLYPEKVKIAKFSEKDANDMLKAGKGVELKKAIIFQAQHFSRSGLKTTADFSDEELYKPVEYGLSWPWPTLTKLSYGIRRGEIIGLGAGVSTGKSTAWAQLCSHLISVHNKKVAAFFFEEADKQVMRRMIGKMAGVNLTKPEATMDFALFVAWKKWIQSRLIVYDQGESTKWEDVKARIRHLVLVEGVKDIIIDPLSSMTYHLDASKTNDELNLIFGELAAQVTALDFTLYYSSHLNPPEGQKGHEEGAMVRLHQFTGSRAAIKFSHYIIGMERNTQADDEFERNTTTFRILKDRANGRTGTFRAHYNEDTQNLDEIGQEERPTQQTVTGVKY